jgi:ferrous iron transport protein B
MARLPVFIIIASTYFSRYAYFIVAGLYILGFTVALILGFILNKTILKSKKSSMLLEFPPLRYIDIKHILQVTKTNALDMLKRLSGVIICVSIIVWLLTHTDFSFRYTQDISESILFFTSSKISFLFAPMGLNNAGIVCALLVGIMAKELIVSTLTICNEATSSSSLIKSLILPTSVVCLTKASAVSLLIFSLLYFPCASNIAVLKQETDKFTTVFAVLSQFTIAYTLSFIVYQSITKGILFTLFAIIIIAIIMLAIIFIMKKAKQGKCLTCGRCK